MVTEILLHLSASAAYLVLAAHFWKTRWRAAPAAAARGLSAGERAVLALPIVLHGGLVLLHTFAPGVTRFGFAQALSAMLFLAVLIYWIESWYYALDGMQPPALVLAALVVPLPLVFPGREAGELALSAGFRTHLALAIVAYSLFTLALLHALLMALAERRLQQSRRPGRGGDPGLLEGPFARLPPLLTLERLLFRLIGAAFVFLTLTLASGIAFSETLFGRALRFDHKTVFAILSWSVFATLLTGRLLRGWRGRLALRFTLWGFLLLLLAYVGSRFVLEVLLGRT